MLERLLRPEYIFETFRDVTPEFCEQNGIKTIISDIDNTLVTYDDAEPTAEVMEWYKSLNESGVSVAFVSNNDADRVETFNEKIGTVAIFKSGKPLLRGISQASELLGAEKETTALLGDQLLTDICAANRFGIRGIVVPPIKDKKTLFFRAKRAIEKPFMKKYLKEQSKKIK